MTRAAAAKVALLAGTALSACASQGRVAAPPGGTPADSIARGVWYGANEARRAAGADPLCSDRRLEDAARKYARELAGRGELSHESPTRGFETVSARVDAAGGAGWRLVGENLAAVGISERDIPRTTIDMWRDSPPHFHNLVQRRYTRVGTGVARGAEHWYIVQLYGDYPPTQRICQPARRR